MNANNANQIFNWMSDPKFLADDTSRRDEARFLPVEIVPGPAPTLPPVEASGVIELELANGHRGRISGGHPVRSPSQKSVRGKGNCGSQPICACLDAPIGAIGLSNGLSV